MVERSERIVQFRLLHGLERGSVRDWVKGCTGFGKKPKKWTWDGAVDGTVNDFINLYIVFDYRTHMSGPCLSLIFSCNAV